MHDRRNDRTAILLRFIVKQPSETTEGRNRVNETRDKIEGKDRGHNADGQSEEKNRVKKPEWNIRAKAAAFWISRRNSWNPGMILGSGPVQPLLEDVAIYSRILFCVFHPCRSWLSRKMCCLRCSLDREAVLLAKCRRQAAN